MDNINDNDNNHTTLSDESDVNASSPEMPSGLVCVNTATSLGSQTQPPQHVTNVTSFNVNTAKVRSSEYIPQGLGSPTSKSLQSFIGDASNKSPLDDETVSATGTDADDSLFCQNAVNHSSVPSSGKRTESYSKNNTQPMSNDSDFTTITEQKIPSHASSLMSPYPMSVAEHSNKCSPDSNVTLE